MTFTKFVGQRLEKSARFPPIQSVTNGFVKRRRNPTQEGDDKSYNYSAEHSFPPNKAMILIEILRKQGATLAAPTAC